jgi:hypothetical protein
MHEIPPQPLWAILGATGGAVKVFVQLLGMKDLPTKTKIFWLLFANAFVSGFSGFIGAVFSSQMTTNDNYHVIAAGVAGYMGVAALDLFSEWFNRKVVVVPQETP